ncbi:hypothetical protein QE320_gp156 [Pseudomonas phage EM]|uniref:Uncharacterized protein n=1 Tax=Pseudomonas phage EM TaxID=2936914 RepID=A0AAE9KSK2_9CAUD|nr:hypothetical protein QE320_gp156 [Pseudomonas phage EM]UPW35898.1 hypothetical protein EM_113 [Pseudomonas phage EM]
MKLEDIEKGQIVRVSRSATASEFEDRNAGSQGIVVGIVPEAISLSVRVLFGSGETDWGHHGDLSLLHSDPVENKERAEVAEDFLRRRSVLLMKIYDHV